jgi:type I restriction enzyme S subunit
MRSEIPLEDACELIVDCPHNTAKGGNDVFAFAVGTKAISDGRIDFTHARPVDETTYNIWVKRAIPCEGDLILCREAPVGPVARVPKTPRVCLGQRTVMLRPNPQITDHYYLQYALLAPDTQKNLLALAGGSTVAHLNVADVRKFAVILPPLDAQRRIAEVLRTLDDKIDSNRRLAALLEEASATQFRARFVEFLGVDEFEDCEIGAIPRGWRPVKIAEFVEHHRESASNTSELPYIGLEDMPRGSTILERWKTDNIPAGHSIRFNTGDILFGKLRPYFKKVGVAPINGRCSTEIVVVRLHSPEAFGLVLGHLSSQRFIEYCTSVSTGTRMPRSEWKAAGEYVVAAPPREELRSIKTVTEPAYRRIQNLIHENQTLAALRDTLLPKLISGEIRVPDTNDPVEVIGPAAEQLTQAAK